MRLKKSFIYSFRQIAPLYFCQTRSFLRFHGHGYMLSRTHFNWCKYWTMVYLVFLASFFVHVCLNVSKNNCDECEQNLDGSKLFCVVTTLASSYNKFLKKTISYSKLFVMFNRRRSGKVLQLFLMSRGTILVPWRTSERNWQWPSS